MNPLKNYPGKYIQSIELKDGTPATIRPIRPDDAALLQSAFNHLSPQTIYFRFLKSFKELSDEQARHFANVDYKDRMAFVGTISKDDAESLIAVARYDVRVDIEPGAAESAIVVRDDFQNRGMGTAIMLYLIQYAREHGVSAFIATTHTTNTRIMGFIKRSGLPYSRTLLEPGVWEIRVELGDNAGLTKIN
jgi:acetyltransferase